MVHPRRGSILIATAVLVIIATYIAVSSGVALRSDIRLRVAEGNAEQYRDAALNGLRVLISDLEDQAMDFFMGDEIAFEDPYDLYDLRGARASAEVMPLSDVPGSAALYSLHASKININTATRSMLNRVGVLTPEAIDAVITLRERSLHTDLSILTRSGFTGVTNDPVDWNSLFTVWSFDPEITVGASSSSASGDLRTNVNELDGNSSEYVDTVRNEVSEQATNAIIAILESLESEQSIALSRQTLSRRMLNAGVSASDLGLVLDLTRFSEAVHTPGRIDINSAAAEVLRALPGIEPQIAEAIVQARDTLDESQSIRVTWPLEQGLITGQEFLGIAELVTTRSAQLTIRIGVRLEEEESSFDPRQLANEEGFALPPSSESELVCLLEAVLSISGDGAQVLSLVDATPLLYHDALEVAYALNRKSLQDDELALDTEGMGREPEAMRASSRSSEELVSESEQSGLRLTDLARWAGSSQNRQAN